MNRFKSVIDDLEIKEIHLHGRLYTWTRDTDNPAMTQIDHIFCTREWEVDNSGCYVQALSSSMSDHCPMLLTCSQLQRTTRNFRFESYWTRLPGFLEIVQDAWSKPTGSNDHIRTLHIKLPRTAKALKRWGKQRTGALKQQADIANEVILRLDQAQESQQLTAEEISLRRLAKQRVTGICNQAHQAETEIMADQHQIK